MIELGATIHACKYVWFSLSRPSSHIEDLFVSAELESWPGKQLEIMEESLQ